MIPARMNARWITVISGIAIGAICAALISIPAVRALEQQYGLQGLFDLRGPVEPPDHAVLVLMNERSADSISLPRDAERFHRCEDLRVGVRPATHVSLPEMPSRWPRCVHALLLSRLAEAGARIVVFDVLFRERPPLPGAGGDLYAWQDEILARAMAMTPVVIAQKVEESGGQEQLAALSPAIADSGARRRPVSAAERAEPAIRSLHGLQGRRSCDSDAARPSRSRLTPVRVIRSCAISWCATRARMRLCCLHRRPSSNRMASSRRARLLIRELAHKNPVVAKQLRKMAIETRSAVHDPAAAQAIGALGALYSGDGTRLLNPYGPAGTIPSVGYDEVLTAPASENVARFGGRAVFVGYGETSRTEQVEHFSTVYSGGQGADLSGVEIAATAFSNLVDDRTIRELPSTTWLWLTFAAGFLVFVVCHGLGNRVAVLVVIVLAGIYLAVASHYFGTQQLWIPIALPLAVALPIAMLAAFGLKFWTAHQQRARLRDAFSHFVPRDVVTRLEHNAGDLGVSQEAIECACVATDAANFTPLAETMTPEKLAAFLNRYYEALFGRVAERGGIVSDVVGDSMLAIWPDRATDTRRRVLNALLELRDAAEDFNVRLAGNRLQTRFGVDWGRVALTTVGAHGHYEYRAVGDAVNTANRIQELNKRLGTRILVCRARSQRGRR